MAQRSGPHWIKSIVNFSIHWVSKRAKVRETCPQKPAARPQEKNPTPLIVRMAEAHLQTPPILTWEQKQQNNNKKTAPTVIHVACKQPKLQYEIEKKKFFLLILSHYDQDCRGSVFNCVHPEFFYLLLLRHCKWKPLLKLFFFSIMFPFFWNRLRKKKFVISTGL